MTRPDEESMDLSLAKSKAEARFFGIGSAIFFSLFLVLWIIDKSFIHWKPLIFVQAIALLGLVVWGSAFAFFGLTVVSLVLSGWQRRYFQIGVSVAVPAILSLYFIRNTRSLSIQGLFGDMLSPWYLIPVGLIVYVSWCTATKLDAEHPFRGFLIAAAILFVICLTGDHGIRPEYDEDTDSNLTYAEAVKRAEEKGRYFGQYLVYVSAVYATMIIQFMKKRTLSKAVTRAR